VCYGLKKRRVPVGIANAMMSSGTVNCVSPSVLTGQ